MTEYATFVFRHTDADAAKALCRELVDRFPFGEKGIATAISAISIADVMSAVDAAREALECRSLSEIERCDLALELLECPTWEACLDKFAEWDLQMGEDGLTELGRVSA